MVYTLSINANIFLFISGFLSSGKKCSLNCGTSDAAKLYSRLSSTLPNLASKPLAIAAASGKCLKLQTFFLCNPMIVDTR